MNVMQHWKKAQCFAFWNFNRQSACEKEGAIPLLQEITPLDTCGFLKKKREYPHQA
jgi:hypothetical protein